MHRREVGGQLGVQRGRRRERQGALQTVLEGAAEVGDRALVITLVHRLAADRHGAAVGLRPAAAG